MKVTTAFIRRLDSLNKHMSYPFKMTKNILMNTTEQRNKHKKGKGKVQGVPQSQTAALPRHLDEEETDKSKQAQIEQTYEKH